MSSKPVAVVGSPHLCPRIEPGTPPRPHIGGPVISAGQSIVKINGIKVAVEGGKCLCTGKPGPDKHKTGSSKVKINGKGVMRVGDKTAHGGRIVMGVPHVKFH